jgi:glyoxylase-like metal-dependent hydrolase (beta-lactamase superfamily II)
VHWTAQPAPEGGDAARRVFEIYGNRLRRAAHGEEVLPGVTLHQMAGHTPGHSGFMIQSGGESLLLWGDTVNLPAIFFARPDAFLGFDSDPNQARETRRRMFDMVATDKLLVAGNHHDFPLFGHLLKHGDGYAWEPMVWAPSAAGLAA